MKARGCPRPIVPACVTAPHGGREGVMTALPHRLRATCSLLTATPASVACGRTARRLSTLCGCWASRETLRHCPHGYT
eukprot:scaffold326281_cov94-Tisochrysis_lutea.AAC.1